MARAVVKESHFQSLLDARREGRSCAGWPCLAAWCGKMGGPVGCPPQVSGPGREGDAPRRRAMQEKRHMGPSWHHGVSSGREERSGQLRHQGEDVL